ncbi:MAG: hypothetical protein ACM3O4_00495 [Ignavibacteriales bacterium]
MDYVLLLLIVLNTAIAFAIHFDKRVEETIFLSIIVKIFILFLSGVFFNLLVGYYFILILGIPLLIFNIKSIYKNKTIIKEKVLTVGFCLLMLGSLLFIWTNHNRLSIIWDEFSHWALVVKNMYLLNNFGIGLDGNVIAKSYLSGTSLFQYFAVKLSGTFNEGMLYFGMNLTFLSLILPMFKNFKNIKNLSIHLAFIMIMIVPTLFYPDLYNSLYVDAILGTTFAYSIYSYYLNYNDGLNKFNIINLSASLLFLIMIKEIGMVFAFLTFVIIFIDNIFIRNKFKFNLKYIWRNSKYLIFSLIPLIAVKLMWIGTLIVKNVNLPLQNDSMLDSIKTILSGNLIGYRRDVVYDYIKALFYTPLTDSSMMPITFFTSVGIFIIIFYILTNNMKKSIFKNSYILSGLFILLGAIGYSFLLLLTYLTIFCEYEAVNLASFQRYISTYTLGMFIIIIALLINKYRDKIKEFNKLLIIFFTFLLCFANFIALLNTTIFAREIISNTHDIRNSYKQFKNMVDKYVTNDNNIYFISTNDNGFDFYVANYEITPKKMNVNYAWSIGKKYSEDDIWTVLKTTESWKKELIENYDFVYLFDIDQQFVDQYGQLFNSNIEDNQLYKVNKDNKVILELILP